VDYPVGHRRRRAEGAPLLAAKFEQALAGQFSAGRVQQIVERCRDPARFDALPVHELMTWLAA
ncbi:MAG TPA: 2-methylcitrate dehydratase, partial [Tahibacter sp.]|nr:2-methylcitrate dehydratase [Tahibacter sp.]